MEKRNIKDISQSMSRIRKQKKKIITNYYYTYNHSEVLFDVIEREETILFGIQEVDIYRVFYYSCNEKELEDGLREMPEGTILDIIAKEDTLEDEWLNQAGFKLYNVYGRFGMVLPGYEEQKERMAENRLDQYYNEGYGEYAKAEDVEEIQEKIRGAFDSKTDHLFSDEQMNRLIQDKSVYVQRENGRIFCIVIYRIEGKKLYYNLTFNEGTADVSYSIEKKILLQAIRDYGVNYSYSWIALTNKKALKRNGAPSDDVYNYIYEKQEDK